MSDRTPNPVERESSDRSARLRICLERHDDGEGRTLPMVVARITPSIGERWPVEMRRENTRDNVLVPIATPGWERWSAPIAVRPGSYVIEARLPSGELVTDAVDALPKRQHDIRLRGTASPHEWLSLANLVGANPIAPGVPRSIREGDTAVIAEGRKALAEAGGGTKSLLGQQPILRELIDWHHASFPWRYVTHRSIEALTGPHDPPTARIDTRADGAMTLIDLRGEPGFPQSEAGATWALVETQAGFELAAAPLHWRDAGTYDVAGCSLLLSLDAAPGEPATSVMVRDSVVGSALGYFTAQNQLAARELIDQALSMLLEKVANPVAAAAGAYILLASRAQEDRERWHDWVRNLSNWFPKLPDGPVIEGWLALHRRKSDAVAARGHFLRAYGRGIPAFSAGVRLLIDGLSMFADEDEECAMAARDVRRVGRKVDQSQPFTVVSLPRHARTDEGD